MFKNRHIFMTRIGILMELEENEMHLNALHT